MKKLKIFLMLSILLCFGFVLSSEVHAQGDGPKVFEIGDVLPATTQLQIAWNIEYYAANENSKILTSSNYFFIDAYSAEEGNEEDISVDIQVNGVWVYNTTGETTGTHIIDTSSWSEAQRTVTTCSLSSYIDITWEDLNAPSGFSVTFEENGGTEQTDLSDVTALPDPLPIPTKENHTFVGWSYDDDVFTKAYANDPLTNDVILYARWLPGKLFEENEVLPATTELKIRILFGQGDYHVETVDRSGIYLNIDWIGGVKDFYIEIGGNVQYDGEVTSDEIYYTIDISNWSLNQRTIKSVSSENGTFVTWEDITPDGYTQGYLEAREEFGYYDSRTNEWLSVDEYLDLYGTEKMDQSDFFNNFDKYFIPALIIVFGGAIVLTILKVFKGRE